MLTNTRAIRSPFSMRLTIDTRGSLRHGRFGCGLRKGAETHGPAIRTFLGGRGLGGLESGVGDTVLGGTVLGETVLGGHELESGVGEHGSCSIIAGLDPTP